MLEPLPRMNLSEARRGVDLRKLGKAQHAVAGPNPTPVWLVPESIALPPSQLVQEFVPGSGRLTHLWPESHIAQGKFSASNVYQKQVPEKDIPLNMTGFHVNVNPGLINPWLINRGGVQFLLVVGFRPLLEEHPRNGTGSSLRSWVNMDLHERKCFWS